MPRTREFDFDRALDRAMRLFWAKGYSNTSLRDLLRVMRIGEGSFYNCVRGKTDLYLQCLKRYNDVVTGRRLNVLQGQGSIGAVVRRFFKSVLDDLDDPATPRVCLMAGSLSGDVLAERELERYVIAEMTGFQKAFLTRFETAQQAGELPRQFDCQAAAQLLVTYLQGMFRVVRVLNTRRQIERQLDSLLRGLGV
jgi:TetR/AcrR family transcriptional repressor of nem operon